MKIGQRMWKLNFGGRGEGQKGRTHLAYVTFAIERYMYAKFGKNQSVVSESIKNKQIYKYIYIYNFIIII